MRQLQEKKTSVMVKCNAHLLLKVDRNDESMFKDNILVSLPALKEFQLSCQTLLALP